MIEPYKFENADFNFMIENIMEKTFFSSYICNNMDFC